MSFLADVLDRIACGIKEMAPLVLVLGCQSPSSDSQGDQPAPVPEVKAEAAVSVKVAPEPVAPRETGPRQIGHFNITFYYVVGEEEIVAKPAKKKKEPANDNQVAAAAGSAGSAGSAGAVEAAGSAGSAAAGSAAAGSGEAPAAVAGGEAAGSGAVMAAGSGSDAVDLTAAAPPEKVTLYGMSPDCEPIVETTREFAFELNIQGTGKLKDGRVLNVWGPCNCPTSPCWKVVEQQWGMGGAGRPLQPFRTVAVDPKLIKLGSLLYIPLLEGRTMPGRPPWGGFIHDGCVVADDTGGAIRDHQLDLFVGRRGWFLGMSGHPGPRSWARHIPVFDGSKICERKGRKIFRKTGAI
jgi:3D (Asp-Asp-Asp) domain-containing protein